MKKTLYFGLVFLTMMSCVSCGKAQKKINLTPQASQMKSICELATMDCYYHNVAKYTQEDASGALWWKKDRNFWVEYAGIVTIGIDASLLNIVMEEENVTITMPPAKILSCKVDETTLTKDSFIVDKDSAKVEAEHQTEAFKEAQTNMKQAASEDTLLLNNAQQRAQKLLEDYLKNIGEQMEKEYKVHWIYSDEKGTTPNSTPTESKAAETIVES